MNNNEVAKVIGGGLVCLIGACVLAVPFYGLSPMLTVCLGLFAGCYAFKLFETRQNKETKKSCK